METVFAASTMVGISLLGSLLYTVIKAKKYFRPGIFSGRIFWRENKFTWLYSILVCSIIAIIINVVPNSATAIESATGLAVSEEIASFITLGYALCASMKRSKGPEIDSNET